MKGEVKLTKLESTALIQLINAQYEGCGLEKKMVKILYSARDKIKKSWRK